MESQICKNCEFFLQHYILDEQRCTPINCGHCRYPRLKHREPGHRACSNFKLRNLPAAVPDRDRVLRFLTTEFLQYVLSLDLPPESTGRE